MISIGAPFPKDIQLKKITGDAVEDFSTSSLSQGTYAIFGLPGAFTPTCSNDHLPSMVKAADALKAQGVDQVFCLAVNDFFVLKAWGKSAKTGTTISFLADGNGELTRALGLTLDLTALGFGQRSQRYSMLIKDGIVKKLNVESSAGECTVSRGESLLS